MRGIDGESSEVDASHPSSFSGLASNQEDLQVELGTALIEEEL